MKFLTLLSFQAFVIALLCSSAFAAKNPATLDEVIKALGSMYQQKLFAVRDESDDYENLGGSIIGGEPVPDLRETVTVPRYHYCMKSIPYCVTFYGTMIVQDKPMRNDKRRSEPQRKNIRNAQDQLCLKNITFGECSDAGKVRDEDGIVDVSSVQIPDFCFPGMIELSGSLAFQQTLTVNTTVHVQMNPTNLPKPSNRFYEPTACSQIGYFYNLCELLDRTDTCPNSRGGAPLPCSCEISPDDYSLDGFQKMVDEVDFFSTGERSGFAVVSNDRGKSCFTFSFFGTVGTF